VVGRFVVPEPSGLSLISFGLSVLVIWIVKASGTKCSTQSRDKCPQGACRSLQRPTYAESVSHRSPGLPRRAATLGKRKRILESTAKQLYNRFAVVGKSSSRSPRLAAWRGKPGLWCRTPSAYTGISFTAHCLTVAPFLPGNSANAARESCSIVAADVVPAAFIANWTERKSKRRKLVVSVSEFAVNWVPRLGIALAENGFVFVLRFHGRTSKF
jgi:hypothetical protein